MDQRSVISMDEGLTAPTARARPSYAALVGMMAAAMALHALAIDAMLPSLTEIGGAFGVVDGNRLQWIIASFVIGAGCGQLFYGPLSDWLGRRPVLLTGLLLYSAFSLLASFATGLPGLIALRVAEGIAAAACSVIPRSIIRDLYEGRQMARVMSLTFLVFLTVPILAPTIGQALLLFVPWQGIFAALAIAGTLVAGWMWFRLPETLHPEYRRQPTFSHLSEAARIVLTEPNSIYYTLAVTAMSGTVLAYVSTVPQIFASAFHAPRLMPVVFALCAGTMGVGAYFNSRIVERVGMRRISHTALICFIVLTAIHMLIARDGTETIVTFAVMQALTMGCFALSASNFGAMAMQRMGEIAGSAASVQGLISTIGGALIGSLIGHQWRGSVVFLPAGALCCGLTALGLVLIAEKGVLFRPQTAESGG